MHISGNDLGSGLFWHGSARASRNITGEVAGDFFDTVGLFFHAAPRRSPRLAGRAGFGLRLPAGRFWPGAAGRPVVAHGLPAARFWPWAGGRPALALGLRPAVFYADKRLSGSTYFARQNELMVAIGAAHIIVSCQKRSFYDAKCTFLATTLARACSGMGMPGPPEILRGRSQAISSILSAFFFTRRLGDLLGRPAGLAPAGLRAWGLRAWALVSLGLL